MTGELSRTGYIATYPPADGDNDIFTVDSTRAYQPMATVLEAVRLLYGKSTGLVVTCEFPHATPADCSSHDYSRGHYRNIADQMVHNQLDVVIAGGNKYLTADQRAFLTQNGYTVQSDDLAGLRAFNGKKLWSLFGSVEMPFDLDRDTTQVPALSEMTTKAISTLSKNKNGFFLMVEGSKVDWAAHANDPIGMMTEFLAFDRACKVALDYARKDGNTAVIIVPDHGNSGISIGTSRLPGYDKLTKDQLFKSVLPIRKTADGLADLLNEAAYADKEMLFAKYTDIVLTDKEKLLLDSTSDYSKSPVPYAQRRSKASLSNAVAKIFTARSCFGFTTNGHTGEEVFLANYHPKGDIFQGVHFGFEVNDYLCSLYKLTGKLPALTEQYFAKHTSVFKGMTYQLNTTAADSTAELTVTNKDKTLKLRQNSNTALYNGKPVSLPTVVVYVDRIRTFYLPAELADWMN
jgi:alkaline phosphatase